MSRSCETPKELSNKGLWADLKSRCFYARAAERRPSRQLLLQNVSPKVVQKMVGHANISQTMDTYSHVMPGM
jgi:site-specific recombinase XerD